MPHPWLKRIRDTGQLIVFNKATAWAAPVGEAIKSFNNLPFGVTLVAEKDEKAANIVLVLGIRAGEQYPYYGTTAITRPRFDPAGLHGQATTFNDPRSKELFFAVAFLPGKVKKATNGQKEVIVVHELIHAAGSDEWHDSEGIMYDVMQVDGGGLIEASRPKGASPMPPIRLGAATRHEMSHLWP